jgi:hypothetical protein
MQTPQRTEMGHNVNPRPIQASAGVYRGWNYDRMRSNQSVRFAAQPSRRPRHGARMGTFRRTAVKTFRPDNLQS